LPEPFFSKEKREQIYQSYRKQSGVKTDFDLATAIYTDFLWQCVSEQHVQLIHITC
jgi:hypothetical protein